MSPAGTIFQKRFAACDSTPKCSGDPSRNTALLELRTSGPFPKGVVFFEAKMGVDADGSEWAKKKYAADVAAHKRIIDRPDTSLRYTPGGASLDSDKVAYIVIPRGEFPSAMQVELGDVAAVVHDGKVAYAVVGDEGPVFRIGEGSIELHERLGHHICKKRDLQKVCTDFKDRSIDSGVLYFVFRGTAADVLRGVMPENIDGRTQKLGSELFEKLSLKGRQP